MVRTLGTGSYAVVYHVRVVFFTARRLPRTITSILELSSNGASATRSPTTEFSREYAIKLLSKTDLDEELVARPHRCVPHLIHSLQVLSNDFQVTRQPIPAHPNIVSLYCTLETSAYLLIFFSGQELFYFLE